MRSFYTIFYCFIFVNLAVGQEYRAILSGHHQSTPVMTLASGEVAGILDGDTLRLSGAFDGIRSGVDTAIAGGAHLHSGIAGMNGGVVTALNPTLSEGMNGGIFDVATNTYALDEDLKGALNARALYINIHSRDHRGGELRGQILPSADDYYSCQLFGSNVNPAVMSDGSGLLMLELHGDTVVISGSIRDLSTPLAVDVAGGIHIHEGRAGSNGGVIHPLVVELSPDSLSMLVPASQNTFVATPEQIQSLVGEGWYVNVHTARFIGGELRGQLTPVANVKMRAGLSGANHTPPVLTTGRGKLSLGLRGDTLTVSGSMMALSSAIDTDIGGGAHVHFGVVGSSGGVVFPLALTLTDEGKSANVEAGDNQFIVSGDTLMELLSRSFYVNVHTKDRPGGEIRGQIVPESQYFLQAYLSASQQVSQVLSNGDGALILEVLGGKATASGSFGNMSTPLAINVGGGAHIHYALAGSNGPVVHSLTTSPNGNTNAGRFRAVDNEFVLEASRRDSVKRRMGYVNVHSEAFNGGELRGQLLHEAMIYFYTPLSGAQQVPPVLSEGRGAVALELNGSNAILSGSFSNLSSALATDIRGGAHLHGGIAGSSGGVLADIAINSSTGLDGAIRPGNNIFTLSEGLIDSLRRRMVYANIHTDNFRGGELRGNLRPLARNLYAASLSGKNATNPNSSTGVGTVLIEQTGETHTLSGSFQNLSGDFDASIGGGVHVHLGLTGSDGGVLAPLNVNVSQDLKSGVFPSDSNSVQLPDSIGQLLGRGGAYVNIHTTEIPPGEIRGQILPEINFAPDQVAFHNPISGDTITIEGNLDSALTLSWNESTDPNTDPISYVWQLSANSDFSGASLAVNTGQDAGISISYGTIDTLLSIMGVDSGEVAVIYHRIVATDGSLCSAPTLDSIHLLRSVSTNITESEYLQDEMVIFPSITSGIVNIKANFKFDSQLRINLISLDGKTVTTERSRVFAGENLIRRDYSALTSGLYLIQLVLDDQVQFTRRIYKE